MGMIFITAAAAAALPCMKLYKFYFDAKLITFFRPLLLFSGKLHTSLNHIITTSWQELQTHLFRCFKIWGLFEHFDWHTIKNTKVKQMEWYLILEGEKTYLTRKCKHNKISFQLYFIRELWYFKGPLQFFHSQIIEDIYHFVSFHIKSKFTSRFRFTTSVRKLPEQLSIMSQLIISMA